MPPQTLHINDKWKWEKEFTGQRATIYLLEPLDPDKITTVCSLAGKYKMSKKYLFKLMKISKLFEMTGQLPRIGVFATLGLPGRSEVKNNPVFLLVYLHYSSSDD